MKKGLVTGLLALSGGAYVAWRKWRARSRHGFSPPAVSKHEAIERRLMLAMIVPGWILAGLSDYLWHRHTKIETTSGTAESIMHLLMLAEAAPAVLAGLLLEVNAGVLALMLASVLIHEATVIVDVGMAAPRRVTPPGEQHTHSFLEVLPFATVGLYCATHWEQFLVLLGLGNEKPRYAFRLRKQAVPPGYLIPMVTAITLLDALPHIEELWRCVRAQRRGETGRDIPECAPELFGEYGIDVPLAPAVSR